MAFWGCQLKAKELRTINVPKGKVLHVSQISLFEPSIGKNYVRAKVSNVTFNMVCLQRDKAEHCATDLYFGQQETQFHNDGPNEVHIIGYLEDPPAAEEVKSTPAGAMKAISKTAAVKTEVAVPVSAGDAKKLSLKPPMKAGEENDDAEGSEEEIEEEIEEEVEEEVEVEESEEEEADEPEDAKIKKHRLENAEHMAAKKAKIEAHKRKAVLPVKDTTTLLSEYVKALVDYIDKNGQQKIWFLAEQVKRSGQLPKLRKVLESHPELFAISQEDVVSKKK